MDLRHDGQVAGRTDAARKLLLAAGGGELARQPWQHPAEPADNATLLRFALWRASGQGGSASADELAAAIRLIESARSDLDTLETALLFTARAEGMTWSRIADLLGLSSPQAAQQRYQRTSQRPAAESSSTSGTAT